MTAKHASIGLEQLDEQELLARIPHEPDAFRELYRRTFDRVFAYVAYRVGRRQDAEDITAEVFMSVVEHLARFQYRGEGSFTAWLFRIAHNAVTSFYRRQRVRAMPLSLEELPDIQGAAPLPDQIVQQKERFAALHTAIQRLSPRRQEIVTLRFFGGLRNNEIAVVLGLDERTVASHLSRALEDLHSRLIDAPELEVLF